jgi:hypothetical protein
MAGMVAGMAEMLAGMAGMVAGMVAGMRLFNIINLYLEL